MTGVGEESISISGAVFNYRQNGALFDSPVTATGTDQVTQMREEAAKGLPLRVALDDGRSLGFWVVKSIRETQSNFIGTAPLKQAFDIKLAFFGDKL
jgi:phage protein U